MTTGFRPWVGERFEQGLHGTRLLIVGESHHGPAKQNEERDFTIRCVRNVVSGEWKLRFFRNLQSIFVDSGLGVESPNASKPRADFWGRVAFYNYVQEMVAKPGVAPSESAWGRAREPLAEVMKDLQPHCVLFACKRLFVRATDRFEATTPLSVDGALRHIVRIPYENEHGTASYILHPSYRGYRKQRAWVAALLQRAQSDAVHSSSALPENQEDS